MSNPPLSFNPVFPIVLAIAIALALLAFFVYGEFKRKLKFLSWRVIASCGVVMSLLGIFLRPQYQEVKKPARTLLLTRGYPQDKVDSIVQMNPALKIIRTRDAAFYSNSSILKSWYALRDENLFCVAGEGISSDVLDFLRHKVFQFFPGSQPLGITRLIIPNTIYANDRARLQGQFNASEKIKLKLSGPGGTEDSITLSKGEGPFSLSFTPKQSGNFMYSISSENVRGSKHAERLPVVVLPEKQLRVLFIQKFPTAEVQHLKNFLSEKKHQVGLRYQVSKDNFIYEYANMPRVRIAHLDPDLLNSFDLLFIDQKSYDELNTPEKKELRRALAEGLGVIIILNDPNDKLLNEFLPVKSKASSVDTAHLSLSSHAYVLPTLPMEFSFNRSPVAVIKNKNRLLSGYFFSGRGKIGFQLIQETFRLSIEGNTDDYASLWVTLIRSTARTEDAHFKLNLITPFPYYTNRPIEMAVSSSGPIPPLYADSASVALKEHARVDDYWTGQSWATQSGWHQLRLKGDSTQLNYFVSDTSEWKSLRICNQIRDNRLAREFSTASADQLTQPVPVPAILFYLLFLSSSAFLWLAPKM